MTISWIWETKIRRASKKDTSRLAPVSVGSLKVTAREEWARNFDMSVVRWKKNTLVFLRSGWVNLDKGITAGNSRGENHEKRQKHEN